MTADRCEHCDAPAGYHRWNCPAIQGPRHFARGLVVRRGEDGTVGIALLHAGHEIRVPVNEWASLVAFTTARGEKGETFAEALALLERGGKA